MNALQSAPPHSVPAQARKTPELRPYQVDFLQAGRNLIGKGKRRILMQMATGGGKMTVSAAMFRMAVDKGKRAIYFAHRKKLVTQKAERLGTFGVPHSILMPGYDYRPGCPVAVASKDTVLARAVRTARMDLPDADLVLVDEAHTSTAEQYQFLLSRYRNAIIVGMTATPAGPDGKGMGGCYEAMACAVPTSKLVKDGYLVPVRAYHPESAEKARRGKGEAKRKGLRGDPVGQWLAYAAGRPTVLFARKVEESKALAFRFCAAGIPAEHIDGSTPEDEREAVFDRIEAGVTKVVCNCSVMVEGVDIPCLSCIQIVRAMGSFVSYAQACGRIMRPFPGKEYGVILDHSGAAFVHGLPDEDVEWTLDAEDSVEERNRKAKKEGKRKDPVVCPKCSSIFSNAPACPYCGYALPKGRGKEAPIQQELLVEYDRAQAAKAVSPAERLSRAAKDWISACWAASGRGGTAWAAAMVFKGKHKCLPDQFPGLAEAARQKGYALPRGQQWRQPAIDLFPQCQRGG